MPKSKPQVSSSSGSDSDSPPKAKKAKQPEKEKPSKAKAAKSSSGEVQFQLGKMRFATISEFKGRKMVNIREFYTDAEGEMKPGRKGIALSEEQWKKLKEFTADIDEALEDL